MLKKLSKDWNVPDDFYQQTSSLSAVKHLSGELTKVDKILDLGCGIGTSALFFKEIVPNAQWIGIDIEESPEVSTRTSTSSQIYTFDGINIPFADNTFDLIFSNQVLEHVKHPTKLLREARRVLKPKGYIVGSTSHLEPYHSLSIRNFTPYGFKLLIEDAGLQLEEIRPGIDSLTLIVRLGLGRPKIFNHWFQKESPLNKLINIFGKISGKTAAEINVLKLIFCGQFSFIVRK